MPDWKDRHDILAALRLSNYDPHDCISTYMAVGDKGTQWDTRHMDLRNMIKLYALIEWWIFINRLSNILSDAN